MTEAAVASRLERTRNAFDALARDYDRSECDNELLLRLRHEMWRVLTDLFPPGSRLLDLGCGTGIDAVFLANRGRHVVAVDVSPEMVARTRERAEGAGLGDLVDARPLAIEALQTVHGVGFDGIYANRGPLGGLR
jgi:ubiquinone/menaquinone biosynthesis C-methylase UbiE